MHTKAGNSGMSFLRGRAAPGSARQPTRVLWESGSDRQAFVSDAMGGQLLSWPSKHLSLLLKTLSVKQTAPRGSGSQSRLLSSVAK